MTLVHTAPYNNLPMQVLRLLEKPETYFHTGVDAITLSCTSQRLGTFHGDLDSLLLSAAVSSLDYEKANDIKKFYGQMLICEQLKGKNLSEFRKELALLLSADSLKYKDSWKGIIYKLPYFYDYDKKLEELKQTVFTKELTTKFSKEASAILRPVCKLYRNVRQLKKYTYFFEIENTNSAAKICISKDSCLLDTWDHLFEQNKFMEIAGNFNLSMDQNLQSYEIKNFKILNLYLS